MQSLETTFSSHLQFVKDLYRFLVCLPFCCFLVLLLIAAPDEMQHRNRTHLPRNVPLSLLRHNVTIRPVLAPASLVQCAEGAVAYTLSVDPEDVYFVGNAPFAHLEDGSEGGAEADVSSPYKVKHLHCEGWMLLQALCRCHEGKPEVQACLLTGSLSVCLSLKLLSLYSPPFLLWFLCSDSHAAVLLLGTLVRKDDRFSTRE